jgi:hypothetical protein
VIRHFFINSVLWFFFRLCLVLIAIAAIFSCQSAPRPVPPRSASSPAVAADQQQREILKQLADKAVIALAARDLAGLEKLLAPSQTGLTAQDAFNRFLGSHAETMILQRWDAGKIAVTIAPDGNKAEARIPIIYRAAPNRPLASATLNFQFQKNPHDDSWKLVIPEY